MRRFKVYLRERILGKLIVRAESEEEAIRIVRDLIKRELVPESTLVERQGIQITYTREI